MERRENFSLIYRSFITFLIILIFYYLIKKELLFYQIVFFYIIFSLSFVWLRMVTWGISDVFPKKHYPDWNKPFTVVVPVKNENKNRFKQVIESIIRSDGKKQILIGSDGSTSENNEDYKKIISELERENQEDIKFIELSARGKRRIQCDLHRIAKYDIIVNVDSDVVVWKKTFVRLLAPFQDKKVGITNSYVMIPLGKRLIDKYYNVLYICANQVGRKSLGRFGIMHSASGELLAYRKIILDDNMYRYENAHFMWGIPITFGEDRLLTNIALKEGYKTVYCEDSPGWTWAQPNLKKLMKQQLRWRRSWIRESVRCLSFSWNKPLLFVTTVCNLLLPILFSFIVVTIFARIIIYQDLISLIALPVIIIFTTILRDLPLLFEERKLIIKLVIFSVYNLFLITPLWIYAIITVDHSGWGTR